MTKLLSDKEVREAFESFARKRNWNRAAMGAEFDHYLTFILTLRKNDREWLRDELAKRAHQDTHSSANWGMKSAVRVVHLDEILTLLTNNDE